MKSRITRNDLSVIAATGVALTIVGVITWRYFGEASIIPFAVVCVVALLWAQYESMRRTSEQLTHMRTEAFNDYRQVESLLSLFATLKPDIPLPPLRDHSASPDFLRRAVLLMLGVRPRVAVELGSGSSTVFLALCLKRLGEGKLISIDHEEVFAERTRAMLVQHDLTEYACVLYKPLKPVRIDGNEYLWYSIDDFKPPGPVELLIVDGPPYHVHPLARYPALPMMLPFMADNCTVLLDDASRPEEIRVAGLWKKDFAEFSSELVEAEKGALILSRSASGSSHGFAGEVG